MSDREKRLERLLLKADRYLALGAPNLARDTLYEAREALADDGAGGNDWEFQANLKVPTRSGMMAGGVTQSSLDRGARPIEEFADPTPHGNDARGESMEACPFCGEVPTQGFVGDEDGGYHAIECRNCNGSDGRPFIGVHSHSSRECRDVWNRRALTTPPTVPEAALEDLRTLALEMDEHDRRATQWAIAWLRGRLPRDCALAQHNEPEKDDE